MKASPLFVAAAAFLAVRGVAAPAATVFSYPAGFAGAADAISTSASAAFKGPVLALTSAQAAAHQAGGAWYRTPQDIRSFTTDFTFRVDPTAGGFTFCVQNSNAATNPTPSYGGIWYGIYAAADANMAGYGAYANQTGTAVGNSVAIKFDLTAANGNADYGAPSSSTGLYINGGPFGATGFVPSNDLTPAGISLHRNDVMAAHVVYDGSTLTMTLRDTATGAQARFDWPVDIPAVVGGGRAWVGFTGGSVTAASQDILSWSFRSGHEPRFATPTFSLKPGAYASAQTVSISAPAGALIYYSTNGQVPTAASPRYTGPVTLDSSQVLQAIASGDGHEDSAVAVANYRIAPPGSPAIDFHDGFAHAAGLVRLTGSARAAGSDLQLTDARRLRQSGAAWFVAPVQVKSFETSFTMRLTGADLANGLTFAIQNLSPAVAGTGRLWAGGGPSAIGVGDRGLGYQGISSSVALAFGIDAGHGGTVTLCKGGVIPADAGVRLASSSNVSLTRGHPLEVRLSYHGASLSVTVIDTLTRARFSHRWTVDIPALVGGDTAYVGFTAATGFKSSLQQISAWTFSED